ncbi:hypothetical protein [Salinicoccus sp. HZC-1]|uniref:hypothetical protein n=1 Tax=Salinicoccus sp. HZC-1 TaxID=3385497 RepID=UPI00398A7907
MSKEKKNNIKSATSELTLNTALEVSAEYSTQVIKESIEGSLADIAVDMGTSLVPGLAGAAQNYKRRRFENNIKKFVEELSGRVEIINANLEKKNEEQKEKLEMLFQYVFDFVIDEKQEEKIELMVNGFVKVTEVENPSEDFVLTYYDVLQELRLVDIAALKLMSNLGISYSDKDDYSFHDLMEDYGITYEQYLSVRRNLQRIGLLTTKTDLNIDKDLETIIKSISDIHNFLKKASDSKKKGSLPRLTLPKIKSDDKLSVSQFGKDFMRFFIE